MDSITKKGLLTLDAAEPFKCNQNTVDVGFDRFQFHVGVTNAGATPAMLMSLNVEFKLLNDAEWQQLPNDACDWRRTHGANPLPMAAAPASRVSVSGELRVPHVFGENGAKAAADHRPAFYRSYVARHRPIRFRFTFAAAKGAVSRVFEYVEPVDRFKYETANDKDALFLFLDDDNLIHRRYLHVTAEEDPYGYGNLLKLDGTGARRSVLLRLLLAHTRRQNSKNWTRKKWCSKRCKTASAKCSSKSTARAKTTWTSASLRWSTPSARPCTPSRRS